MRFTSFSFLICPSVWPFGNGFETVAMPADLSLPTPAVKEVMKRVTAPALRPCKAWRCCHMFVGKRLEDGSSPTAQSVEQSGTARGTP